MIDEKNNTIDLTDKGIDLISGSESRDFLFFLILELKLQNSKLKILMQ